MKALRENDDVPEIPLTSLLDVVFLLLVFFLVATNFVRREVDHRVSLPSAAGGEKNPVERRNLVINIRSDGTLVVDGERVERPELRGRVEGWRRGNPDRRVSIRGDAKVDFETVMRVFGVCRAAGVRDIELPVVEPHDPGDAA